MAKPTRCGVRVSTWGSRQGGGRGIRDFFGKKMSGGNFGHAALTITIPVNEKNDQLIERYCKTPPIPYRKVKMEVKLAVLDEQGKLVKGEKNAYEEEVYEIRFSWWPEEHEKEKSKKGKYTLEASEAVDRKAELSGRHFEWKPEWQGYINPETRRYKGKVRETIMTLGPSTIVHSRDATPKKLAQINAVLQLEKIKQDMESLTVLLNKLDDEKQPFNIGFTERTLLDRFVPNWNSIIKNKDNIDVAELKNLRELVVAKRKENTNTINNSIIINRLNKFKDKLLQAQKEREPISLDTLEQWEGNLREYMGREFFTEWEINIENSEELNEEEIKLFIEKRNEVIKNKTDSLKKSLGFSGSKELRPYIIGDEEAYISFGAPPDNVVNLPISANSFSDKSQGHPDGLNVEAMLKQMKALARKDAAGFNIRTKNCSITVGSILRAGVDKPQYKKIFQKKGLGFFGTPQEVHNNASKFQKEIMAATESRFTKSELQKLQKQVTEPKKEQIKKDQIKDAKLEVDTEEQAHDYLATDIKQTTEALSTLFQAEKPEEIRNTHRSDLIFHQTLGKETPSKEQDKSAATEQEKPVVTPRK